MAVLRAANYAKAVHDCTGSFYHHAAFSLRIHASAAVDISALRIGMGPPVATLPRGRTHFNDVRSRCRRAIVVERQIKSYDGVIRHKS
jgi:hypothetical protein